MKYSRLLIKSSLVLSGLLVATTACTRSKSESSSSEKKAEVSTTAGKSSGRSSSGESSSVFRLDSVACANEIPLNIEGKSPIKSADEMPKGNFRLAKMTLFTVAEDTNSSFAISAIEADSFKVNVDCNGTVNSELGESSSSYVDKDGVTHEVSSNNNQVITGSLKVGELIDTLTKQKGTTQREINVKFVNGVLESANSEVLSTLGGRISSDKEVTIVERVEVAKDTFVSARFYKNSDDELDLRLKFEFPADKNGYRVIENGSAIYRRN